MEDECAICLGTEEGKTVALKDDQSDGCKCNIVYHPSCYDAWNNRPDTHEKNFCIICKKKLKTPKCDLCHDEFECTSTENCCKKCRNRRSDNGAAIRDFWVSRPDFSVIQEIPNPATSNDGISVLNHGTHLYIPNKNEWNQYIPNENEWNRYIPNKNEWNQYIPERYRG